MEFFQSDSHEQAVLSTSQQTVWCITVALLGAQNETRCAPQQNFVIWLRFVFFTASFSFYGYRFESGISNEADNVVMVEGDGKLRPETSSLVQFRYRVRECKGENTDKKQKCDECYSQVILSYNISSCTVIDFICSLFCLVTTFLLFVYTGSLFYVTNVICRFPPMCCRASGWWADWATLIC